MSRPPVDPEASLAAGSIDGLRERGFTGFRKLVELILTTVKPIPDAAGLFAICRPSDTRPSFLTTPRFEKLKGRPVTVPEVELLSRWVPSAQLVYLGSAFPDSPRPTLDAAFTSLLWHTRAGLRNGALVWH